MGPAGSGFAEAAHAAGGSGPGDQSDGHGDHAAHHLPDRKGPAARLRRRAIYAGPGAPCVDGVALRSGGLNPKGRQKAPAHA